MRAVAKTVLSPPLTSLVEILNMVSPHPSLTLIFEAAISDSVPLATINVRVTLSTTPTTVGVIKIGSISVFTCQARGRIRRGPGKGLRRGRRETYNTRNSLSARKLCSFLSTFLRPVLSSVMFRTVFGQSRRFPFLLRGKTCLQVRHLFIRVEDTPNEHSLIFKPGKSVTGGPILEFRTPLQAQRHSDLADDLFRIGGVVGLLFGRDFITVSKEEDASWDHLKPSIFAAITEHYSMDRPILKAGGNSEAETRINKSTGQGTTIVESPVATSSEKYIPEDVEVVAMIKEILDTRIRPVVQDDGGDVQFMSYREGIVELQLRGACRSCSSSTITLKNGIEAMLMHYVPEVKEVRQVEDPLEATSQAYFEQIEAEKEAPDKGKE